MRSKKLLFSLLAVVIIVGFSTAESSAIDAYMLIEGDNQGIIVGSSTHSTYPDWIIVASFGHSLTVPIDAQSGQATAQRRHGPLRIVKPVSVASPRLYMALTTGENLERVEIKFVSVNLHGQEQNFFTILLEGAVITSIASSLIPSDTFDQMMEIVTFSYQKITWTYEDGGIAHTDDWRQPK